MLNSSSNWHSTYPVFKRHWHAGSEDFAGGDALLTALDDDWTVSPTCYREEYWQAGTRLVTVFHFELQREGEKMNMPVITSPYIRRIIRNEGFNVKPIAERGEKEAASSKSQ